MFFPKVVWSHRYDNYKQIYKELKKLNIKTITVGEYCYDNNIIIIYSIKARKNIKYRIYLIIHEYLHSLKIKPLDDFIDWLNILIYKIK